MPKAITPMTIKFPIESLYDATSGCAAVVFTVAPDGSVADAHTIYSVPGHVFDRSAEAAVLSTRFEPSREGRPVTTATWLHYQIGEAVPGGCKDSDLQAALHAWGANNPQNLTERH